MEEKYKAESPVDVKSDDSKKIEFPDLPKEAGSVYFLKLVLTDNAGKEISSNFYWLSSKGDEKADFTVLNSLPIVNLNFIITSLSQADGKWTATVEIENPSANLAFSVNPKILKSGSRNMVLPVYWEDNYFSLLPGEKRTLKVEFNAEDLGGENPVLVVDGWNINHLEKELK
jgi:hypothetical protein